MTAIIYVTGGGFAVAAGTRPNLHDKSSVKNLSILTPFMEPQLSSLPWLVVTVQGVEAEWVEVK